MKVRCEAEATFEALAPLTEHDKGLLCRGLRFKAIWDEKDPGHAALYCDHGAYITALHDRDLCTFCVAGF